MKSLTRALFSLLLPAAMTSVMLLASGAQAATPACLALPVGNCQSLTAPVPGGLDLDVKGQLPASNVPVIGWTVASNDPAEDLRVTTVVSGTDLYNSAASLGAPPAGSKFVNIQYMPNGNPSGFCFSTVNPESGQVVELRPCDLVAGTFNPYQTFLESSAPSDGATWSFQDLSPSTGLTVNLYLTIPRSGIGTKTHRNFVISSPEHNGSLAEGQIYS